MWSGQTYYRLRSVFHVWFVERKQREGSAKTLNVNECVCLLGGSVNVLRDIGGILYGLASFIVLLSVSYVFVLSYGISCLLCLLETQRERIQWLVQSLLYCVKLQRHLETRFKILTIHIYYLYEHIQVGSHMSLKALWVVCIVLYRRSAYNHNGPIAIVIHASVLRHRRLA